MKAELVTEPNSDLKIVNAARISFDKLKTEFDDSDAKLLKYLADHDHWTPFAHCTETFVIPSCMFMEMCLSSPFLINGARWKCPNISNDIPFSHSVWGWKNILSSIYGFDVRLNAIYAKLSKKYPHSFDSFFALAEKFDCSNKYYKIMEVQYADLQPLTFRLTAPIFVFRQLDKTRQGVVSSEISGRYVDFGKAEFYEPEYWRPQDPDVKQGSHDSESAMSNVTQNNYGWSISECIDCYQQMIRDGICKEQARMVLPQSMMTTAIYTYYPSAFDRLKRLRLDKSAQKETRQLVQMMSDCVDQNS